MDMLESWAMQALNFMRFGFSETNQLNGIVIALAATIFMSTWRQLFAMALVAVIVHVAIETLAPIFVSGAQFRLPDLLDSPFWRMAAARYIGYLIVITIFFAVKRVLFRGRAAAAH